MEFALDNLWANYQALLRSAQQLHQLNQAVSLGDFLHRLKNLWQCASLADDDLLDQLARFNQTPLAADIPLAGLWMPYQYHPARKQLFWLMPQGHPCEPFLDEYISRCRQHLVNQLIRPCTSLHSAQVMAAGVAPANPAGFIFHLSRCGSTLVSGCLSELDSTCVFSEAPLLTDLLLESRLHAAEKQACLRAFIDLQAAAFPARPQLIIKWNAWDIFYWDLIYSLYPQVPGLFLVRDPVEVLASHQKFAGRHMSGEPELGVVNPVFVNGEQPLLVFRVGVLRALLMAMKARIETGNHRLVSYRQLIEQGVADLAAHFHLLPTTVERVKIAARAQVNSKQPQHSFVADSQFKQQLFSEEDKAYIRRQLRPLYQSLLDSSSTRSSAINLEIS